LPRLRGCDIPRPVLASAITRSLEALGLRGAPTLLRHLSKFSKGLATATLASGERIAFPACDPYWCRYLYARVPYEPDVEAILRQHSGGRTLIDCGANIGYWSVRAAGLGFKSAIAIEANPQLIPLLQRNFPGTVHHAAVHSESNKTVYLIGGGAEGYLGAFGEPVRTLALRDLGVSGPVLVKLDVEGAEIPAIEGARGMDAIFVYEDWPRAGMAVTRHLLENGYSVSGFDGTPIENPADAIEFNRRTTQRYGPSNLVAFAN
jgi:FkbM family methyltransferase